MRLLLIISLLVLTACSTTFPDPTACSKESASIRGQISYVGHPECFKDGTGTSKSVLAD